MSVDTAYRLLPLPVGDWVFWLPFPLMCLLLLCVALMILFAVGWKLHHSPRYRFFSFLVFSFIPLWGGFLFLYGAKAWIVWTLGWFYGGLLLAVLLAVLRRNLLPYALAILFAALLQHQGSVLMVWALSRT